MKTVLLQIITGFAKNKNFILKLSHTQKSTCIMIQTHYLKLYKENMGLFLDYIQKESPNSQIILNPVRLGYKILKNDNKIEVNKNFKSNAKTQ